MKKTLIVLAALAASVAAAAVTTNTYTSADFTLSGSGTEGVTYKAVILDNALTFDTDWTLDISVTIGSENVNGWGSTMIASGLDASAVSYTGGFQLWRAANGTYKAKVGDATEDNASLNLIVGSTYTITVSYTEETGNLVVSGPGLDVTQQFADTTDAITTLNSAALGHTGWDISITATVGTEDIVTPPVDPEVPGGDTPSIPEPTTATLSLLALAGLAARRRRK